MRNPFKLFAEDLSDLVFSFNCALRSVDSPKSPLYQAHLEEQNFISDIKDTLISNYRSKLVADKYEKDEIETQMKLFESSIGAKVAACMIGVDEEQFGPVSKRCKRLFSKMSSRRYFISMVLFLTLSIVGLAWVVSHAIKFLF